MRDLDLKSLRLLVSVCDAGSITVAARHEHIEPSAISKRISALEESLGTALLVRGRRGVEPTPAGASLLEHARNMLFAAERIEADVASFARGIKGHVRLVASASAVAETLLDDVAAFLRDGANRNIQVDIEERLSKDLVRMVGDGGASLGVCWDRVDFKKLDRRPYRSDELTMVVHAKHPLATRKSVRFEQTLGHEHVGLHPGSSVHTTLQRAAARTGGTIHYRAIVSNFDAALRVVAANLGISVIPRQLATRFARDGDVRVVTLNEPWATRRFAVCFRDEVALHPAAARLASFLVAQAAAH